MRENNFLRFIKEALIENHDAKSNSALNKKAVR